MKIVITNRSFDILRGIIGDADEYIKISSFLFYDEDLCDLLVNKCKSERLDIGVITTPPEAAENDELKEKAKAIQGRLKDAGIKLTICDLEVGKPELTISTRAGGRVPRWFSMHAKFLVTDKHALIMSSDIDKSFSGKDGCNSHIIYEDKQRIKQLLQKYRELKDLPSIADLLGDEYVDQAVKPRKLVKGYPLEYGLKTIREDGFYLLPHDGGGEKVIKETIQHAEKFIYLLFETIYDDELSRLIMEKLITNPTFDLRIITSPPSAYVQNPTKARAIFLQLAFYGAKVNTLKDLRAKMLITDKAAVSGSFDLVKMGRGFKRGRMWVESTEIMDVNTDKDFIEKAKGEFLDLFERLTEEYGKWFMKEAEEILKLAGAKKVAKEAKELLGDMIYYGKRKFHSQIKRISIIAVEIASLRNKDYPYVKPEDVQKADQLSILQERDELDERAISDIVSVLDAESFLKRLEDKTFIR